MCVLSSLHFLLYVLQRQPNVSSTHTRRTQHDRSHSDSQLTTTEASTTLAVSASSSCREVRTSGDANDTNTKHTTNDPPKADSRRSTKRSRRRRGRSRRRSRRLFWVVGWLGAERGSEWFGRRLGGGLSVSQLSRVHAHLMYIVKPVPLYRIRSSTNLLE